MKEKILPLIKGIQNACLQVDHYVPRGRGGWKGTSLRTDEYIVVDGKLIKKPWRDYFNGQVFNEKYDRLENRKIVHKSDHTWGRSYDDEYEVDWKEAAKRRDNFLKANGVWVVDFSANPEGELRRCRLLECLGCGLLIIRNPKYPNPKPGDTHDHCKDDTRGTWVEIPFEEIKTEEANANNRIRKAI